MLITERWTVEGRVQRVGFRYFSMKCARNHCIQGAARNLPDGRVEILAAGSRESLDAFFENIRNGPPSATVTRVHREVLTLDNPDLSLYDVVF